MAVARRPDPLPRRPCRRPGRLPRERCAGGIFGTRSHPRPAPPTAGGGPPDTLVPALGRPRSTSAAGGPDHSARGPHRERPHDRGAGPARRLVRRPGLDRPVPELRGRHAQPADRAREAAAGGAGHLWVPGHGSAARAAELRGFLTLLESIEDGARRAIARGVPAAEGARGWRPPVKLGEWVRFSDDYYEVAFRAWEKELRP